jgi:hypothetical protein
VPARSKLARCGEGEIRQRHSPLDLLRVYCSDDLLCGFRTHRRMLQVQEYKVKPDI